MNSKIKEILSNYESDNPGTKANLTRILTHGKLGGSGKLLILPVDQGFEHGPAVSFAANPDSYDPLYHYKLAIDAGLSAYAAPLGMIEAGASQFAGAVPTILKLNSSNSLYPKSMPPHQAITGSVNEALRLGCSAIGITIYPGSSNSLEMIEQASALAEEAKSVGLVVVIWSYARGEDLSKDAETAVDVIAYAAHIAALIGAHIIKVKLPTNHISKLETQKLYKERNIQIDALSERVQHVKQCCFNGRRIVIFSGGVSKGSEDIYKDAEAIKTGGGNGSIIGRNSFQRPRDEALAMLARITQIYRTPD